MNADVVHDRVTADPRASREGRFPDLIDTVLEVHVPLAWTGADAFLAQMPDWFCLDRTEDQEHALYVAAERTPCASS
ncbi:hypothetical protein [Streptomyces sp. NPDC059575]|uniref:hypothetical protein n=1 Tax=Streptomyces sp. NPDC059575 TaxID=3346872 RepID=UPI00369A3301